MRTFYVVINSKGNELFNSLAGAESWQDDWGGEIIAVREINDK